MIKKIMLILGLIILSSPTQAYDFSSLNTAQSSSDTGKSVVFKKSAPTPAAASKKEPTPQPSAPVIPQKIKLYNNDIKIVALVNGEVISTKDMENRVNAFVMTTQIPLNHQTKNMIKQRVLQAAIDEKLKLQDAEKNGINISEKEIDSSIRNFELTNKIPTGQLKNILKKEQVSEDVFRSQMKSDLAWIRLIKRKTAADAKPTTKEVEEAIQKAEKNSSLRKYKVSEIVIPVKDAQNIQALVSNLRNDPRFELYAMQFSQSPSSSSGGKLGWINEGQLPENLETKLKKMYVGTISDPIKSGNNYYILKLEKAYDPKKDKPEIPSRKEMESFIENQRMEEFANRHLQHLRQQAVIELRN